jgi:hypothetical protein
MRHRTYCKFKPSTPYWYYRLFKAAYLVTRCIAKRFFSKTLLESTAVRSIVIHKHSAVGGGGFDVLTLDSLKVVQRIAVVALRQRERATNAHGLDRHLGKIGIDPLL